MKTGSFFGYDDGERHSATAGYDLGAESAASYLLYLVSLEEKIFSRRIELERDMASESKKIGAVVMLESSAMTPYKYQDWEDTTLAKFLLADLAGLLTGERSSIFADARPKFNWEVELEVRVRNPESDASSLGLGEDFRSAMGGETGSTRPYSFIASGEGGLKESPMKGAEGKGREEGQRAYVMKSAPRSPGVEPRDLEYVLLLATSPEFYFSRLKEFKGDIATWEKDKEFLRGEVSKAIALLQTTVSAKVQLEFRDEFTSRDLAAIWAVLKSACGPSTAVDGLTELQGRWADLAMGPNEGMQDFLARTERLATNFAAYGRKWAKDGEHLKIQVCRALMHDAANWPAWRDEMKDSDKDRDNWGKLKKRLSALASQIAHDELTLKGIRLRGNRFEGKSAAQKALAAEEKSAAAGEKAAAAEERSAAQKALAASPEGLALASKVRAEERKKLGVGKVGDKPDDKPGQGGKVTEVGGAAKATEAEAAVKRQPLCFDCGLRGHIAVDCPWAEGFGELRAKCKAKQEKAARKGEESNCCVDVPPCAGAGNEEEPIEDWLAGAGGEHSMVALADDALADDDWLLDDDLRSCPPSREAVAGSPSAAGSLGNNRFAMLALDSDSSGSDEESGDSSDEAECFSSSVLFPCPVGGAGELVHVDDVLLTGSPGALRSEEGFTIEDWLESPIPVSVSGALASTPGWSPCTPCPAVKCWPCGGPSHPFRPISFQIPDTPPFLPISIDLGADEPQQEACSALCVCDDCRKRYVGVPMPELTEEDSDDDEPGGQSEDGDVGPNAPPTLFRALPSMCITYVDDTSSTIRAFCDPSYHVAGRSRAEGTNGSIPTFSIGGTESQSQVSNGSFPAIAGSDGGLAGGGTESGLAGSLQGGLRGEFGGGSDSGSDGRFDGGPDGGFGAGQAASSSNSSSESESEAGTDRADESGSTRRRYPEGTHKFSFGGGGGALRFVPEQPVQVVRAGVSTTGVGEALRQHLQQARNWQRDRELYEQDREQAQQDELDRELSAEARLGDGAESATEASPSEEDVAVVWRSEAAPFLGPFGSAEMSRGGGRGPGYPVARIRVPGSLPYYPDHLDEVSLAVVVRSTRAVVVHGGEKLGRAKAEAGAKVPSSDERCESGCECSICQGRFPEDLGMPDLRRYDEGSDDDSDGGPAPPKRPRTRQHERGHIGERFETSTETERAEGRMEQEASSPAVETCLTVACAKKPRIVDSGCSSHCSGDPTNALTDFRPGVEYISLGNSKFRVKSEGRGGLGQLSNVMYAPDMSYSMVSVSALDSEGSLTLFAKGRCLVLDRAARDKVLAFVEELPLDATRLTASLRGKLYHVDDDCANCVSGQQPPSEEPTVPYVYARDRELIKGSHGTIRPGCTTGLNDLQRLHLRSGHASKATILAGLKVNAFKGAGTTYETCKGLEIGPCDPCLRGGERQGHVSRSSTDFAKLLPMEEIGMDPVKLSTPSISGENYINFVHCYGTRLAAGVAAKEEGNQVAVLKAVQRDWCTPFGHTIKKLHTDSGSVFLGAAMQKYLLDQGILHDCSSPYQHAHNLVEGGCIRILLDRARVVLVDSGLPARFAVLAIKYAIDSWNAMLHPAGEVMTPYQKVTGKQPDISGFRPFGALLYYFRTKEERNLEKDPRWAAKAERGIMVGYSDCVEGGVLVYPGRNKKIITRKQVLAVETKIAKMLPAYSDRFLVDDPLLDTGLMPGAGDVPSEEDSGSDEGENSEHDAATPPASPHSAHPRPPLATTPIGHRHGHGTRGAAGVGQRAMAVQEVCDELCACCVEPSHCSEQANPAEADNDHEVDKGALVGSMAVGDNAQDVPENPRSMTQALRGPQAYEWRLALEAELESCRSTHSYMEVVGAPERYVRAVMVLRASRKSDGSIKFKARLTPDGSSQVRGLDYDDSFSPTVRKTSIFMTLHIAAAQDWPLEHIDIGSAYKEAMTDEKRPLYMKMSRPMIDFGFSTETYVKWIVNIWGTKEAGQRWYVFISHIMASFGLVRSADDPCQYEMRSKDGLQLLLVLIYVDDIMVTGGWTEKVTGFIEYLGTQFAEVKREALSKYVGMQVTRDRARREIRVHLTEYAKDLVASTVPDHVLGSTTPLYSTVDYRQLPPGEEDPIWGHNGKLRWMADSGWPDLQVATALLAAAGATPSKGHCRGIQKALQYVKLHQDDHDLVLGGLEPVELHGFTDASYTPEGDSRYLYGYALFLSPTAGAYSVKSKRSTTVSHSSAQSEIKAICDACKDVGPDREQLAALGFPQSRPTRLYTDSQASIDLIANMFAMHPKCRHFNRDVNAVRQSIQQGIVELAFIGTDENPADLMTKLLGPAKHAKFTAVLLAGVGLVAVAALAYHAVIL